MSIQRYPHRFMVYPPVVEIRSGRVIFYETLFRTGTDASTQSVCHAAEQEGSIIEVDLYAQSNAQKVLRENPGISLAVNISATTIRLFSELILRQLDQDADSCQRLYFEITESQHIELHALLQFATSCRQRQVNIAQDDFGIAYSTVERARALRPSVLKVVAPLQVEALEQWGSSCLRVAAEVAQEIGALLLVERIETLDAERIALAYGANVGQGYAYGMPAQLFTLELGAQAGNFAALGTLASRWAMPLP